MKICIPSYRRHTSIKTLAQIPRNLWRDTLVFVRQEEYDLYRAKIDQDIEVVPIQAEDISTTRFRIGEYCRKHNAGVFMMLDDDLHFVRRIDPSTTKLTPCDASDMNQMFAAVRKWLGRCAHVGVSIRQGNNNVGAGSADLLVEYNTRIIRAVAYRTKDFMELEHRRINFVEDLDYTLQLLRKGKKNVCLYWWAQDQGMANAPGGCSEVRTLEIHEAAVKQLHSLHPQFVTIVQKNNKTGGEFGQRTESRIQWKAAFEEGRIRNVSSVGAVNQ